MLNLANSKVETELEAKEWKTNKTKQVESKAKRTTLEPHANARRLAPFCRGVQGWIF